MRKREPELVAAPGLKRAVGPISLTLYGVGSMLGAGIYGLVGKAAGVTGSALWASFLIAMTAAMLTAISYASLSSRYPKAAGEAYAVDRAFSRSWLSYLVGMTIVAAGVCSIATQSKVVAANFDELFNLQLPLGLVAAGFLLMLAGLVYRGISESLIANIVCTFFEAGGLLLVVVTGAAHWGSADLFELPPAADGARAFAAPLLLQGAVLTFFSFLGFEDMINVAEEVKNPRRNMPLAVISAVVGVSLIYLAVSITAVSVVPWQDLRDAPAPLRMVIERSAPWFPAAGFTLITIMAVANTALVNYVMGSRLLYGMSREGLLPEIFGRVGAKRQTPHISIALILIVILGLQLAGDISQLAAATVLLLLVVFVVVNAALVVLKRREGDLEGCFNAPMFAPVGGIAVCLAMIVSRVFADDWRALALSGGLIVFILLIYVATARGRRRASPTTPG